MQQFKKYSCLPLGSAEFYTEVSPTPHCKSSFVPSLRMPHVQSLPISLQIYLLGRVTLPHKVTLLQF